MTRQERAAVWRSRVETTRRTINDVADEYGLDAETLFATRSRQGIRGEARKVVMVRLWDIGLSLSEIGRLVGRDHTTVLAAVRSAYGASYVLVSGGQGNTQRRQGEEARP